MTKTPQSMAGKDIQILIQRCCSLFKPMTENDGAEPGGWDPTGSDQCWCWYC